MPGFTGAERQTRGLSSCRVLQGLNVRRGDYRRAGFCVVTDLGCKRGNEKDLGDRPNAASGNFSELLQV